MRIGVVLPYFGALPNTWALTLRTMGDNTCIDWLIFTDQEVTVAHENVVVTRTTLSALRSRFAVDLGFDASLSNPYKLCDYKPAFGELFAAELSGYDYWGYCDADVVFGDLLPSLTAGIASGASKIYQRGHLSLYRNTPEVSALYRRPFGNGLDFRDVYRSSRHWAFDEVGGMYEILENSEHQVWEDGLLFDINPDRYLLRATSRPRDASSPAYLYDNGRIVEVERKTSSVLREGRYVHLQKRLYVEPIRDSQLVDNQLIGFTPTEIIFGRSTTDLMVKLGRSERQLIAILRWCGRYAKRRAKGARRRLAVHLRNA